MAVLETKDLGITFGGLRAVDDVYLKIEEQEIVGLIDPERRGQNHGVQSPDRRVYAHQGRYPVHGESIIGKKPYQINRIGIARTFQNIRLFKAMTVLDNVKVAMQQHMKYNVVSAILRLPSYWREERKTTEEARELLKIFNMEDLAEQQASNLPYGQQRKLEILRALAARPKLLLLDEPAAGMNPTETRELMETIRQIREMFGVSILLIEHDMSLVMGVCERIYVLDYGTLIADGTPDQIRSNEKRSSRPIWAADGSGGSRILCARPRQYRQ